MIEFLKILLTAMFLIAGMAKLCKAKPLKEQFSEFGFPGYFIFIVGALEVLGAIGIQIWQLSLWASLGLLCLMLGALYQHRKVDHSMSKIAPSAILTLLLILQIFLLV